jgi:uncharacterized protein
LEPKWYPFLVEDQAIIGSIASALPDFIALYRFGSTANRGTHSGSDIDLALLTDGPLPALERWQLQEELARRLGRDVDLVDLREASTVMRVQVLEHGDLLAEGNRHARQVFEMQSLAQYARLNEERRHILADIQARGSIYGG